MGPIETHVHLLYGGTLKPELPRANALDLHPTVAGRLADADPVAELLR